MSLSASLTSNEVKNSAGAEVEFVRIGGSGRETVWAQVGESPQMPHRIRLAHEEVGSGLGARRRSVLSVTKHNTGSDVDGKQIRTVAQITLDIPIGNVGTYDDTKSVLAELTSLLCTAGTATFLYDGSGNGAAALIGGQIV
jgi:hypothetical protein